MKGKVRRLLALVVASLMVVLALGSGPAYAAGPSDVSGTKYADAVGALLDIGVVTGYSDGTFRPTNTVKRSEMAAFLVRADGAEEAAKVSVGATPFPDVTSGNWASGYVNVASTKSLVKGMPDGTFAPDRTVTYAEAVTMIVRLLGRESEATSQGWPVGYIMVAQQLGILQGVDFVRDSPATRGDVAVMIHQALFSVKDQVTGLTLAQSRFGLGGAAEAVRLVITPGTAKAAIGKQVKFTAAGYDAQGREVVVKPEWSVPASIGAIGNDGTFVAWTSGTAQVTARVGSVSATASVIVAGDPVRIVLSSEAATLVGNGQSEAALTATVVDAQGLPVGNATNQITFLSTDPTMGTVIPSIVNAVDGVARVTLRAGRQSGNFRVLATSPNLYAGTLDFTTTLPVISGVRLEVSPSHLANDGRSRATLTARVYDATGHAYVNSTGYSLSVSLSLSGTGVILGTNLLTIAPSQESASTTITSTAAAGQNRVSGTTNSGLPVQPVDIATGPVGDPHHITITVPSDPVVADGSTPAIVTAELQDANGFTVTGDSLTRLTLRLLGGSASVTNPMVTATGGLASFSILNTKSGSVSFTVAAPGLELAPVAGTVSFKPGAPSQLSLEAWPGATVAANPYGTMKLIASVKDSRGNIVSTATNPITLARTGGSGMLSLPPITTVSADSGVATFVLTGSAGQGTDVFQVTSPGLTTSPSVSVSTVITGMPTALSVQPVGTGMVGDTLTVKVKVLDSMSRVVSNDNGRVITLKTDSSSLVINGSGLTDCGIATFTVKSEKPGSFRVWATAAGVVPDTTGQFVSVISGAPDHVELVAAPSSVMADAGSTSTITATVVDRFGNPLSYSESLALRLDTNPYGTLDRTYVTTGTSSGAKFLATTNVGQATIHGTSASFYVKPVTITTYKAGSPTKVVVEANGSVTAGTGEQGSVLKVKVKVTDAAGLQLTSISSNAQVSQVGLIVSGSSGVTHISRDTDDGLSSRGFISNGTTIGSARMTNGEAYLEFTDSKAETVTLTPVFYYFGVRFPGDPVTVSVLPGRAAMLTIQPATQMIPADGQSKAAVTVSITDINGNLVPGAGDYVTLTLDTTGYLSGVSSLAGTTNGGLVNFLLQAKQSVGTTTLRAVGTTYPTSNSATVLTDRAPSKPTATVTDAYGGDATISPWEPGARLVVSFEPRVTRQRLHVLISGYEVPVYTDIGFTTVYAGADPGTTLSVIYVKRSDLLGAGTKEVKVMLESGVGAGPQSDASYLTVVP